MSAAGYLMITVSFIAGGTMKISQGHTWIGIGIIACAIWTAGLGFFEWRNGKK